jgi:hypothetical protein
MTDLRKKLPCTINVLGTEYRVEMRKKSEDSTFEREGFCAYCWHIEHLVVIGDMDTFDTITDDNSKQDKQANRKMERLNLRHEIIHAYLNESGLLSCSYICKDGWAKNEEMIDWIASQSPKIFATYKELGILT